MGGTGDFANTYLGRPGPLEHGLVHPIQELKLGCETVGEAELDWWHDTG